MITDTSTAIYRVLSLGAGTPEFSSGTSIVKI